MIDLLKTIVAFGLGYILGSLNSTMIVARFYGVDIRTQGSKSAGLTNALRVLGKIPALFVLVGDVAKGILACLVGLYIGVFTQSGDATVCVSLLAAGAGAVIGHNWPIFFKFKGGKGALTAAAVMLMISWQAATISLVLFVVIVALTRYVSLGTVCSTIFFAFLSFLPYWDNTIYFSVTAMFLALIIVVKHRENIHRLMSGNENKINF